MNEDTLSLMDERRKAKGKSEYHALNQRVRGKVLKQAKEKWIENKCIEIEEADRRHNSKVVHNIAKRVVR